MAAAPLLGGAAPQVPSKADELSHGRNSLNKVKGGSSADGGAGPPAKLPTPMHPTGVRLIEALIEKAVRFRFQFNPGNGSYLAVTHHDKSEAETKSTNPIDLLEYLFPYNST